MRPKKQPERQEHKSYGREKRSLLESCKRENAKEKSKHKRKDEKSGINNLLRI